MCHLSQAGLKCQVKSTEADRGKSQSLISRKGVIYRKMVGNIFNPRKFRGKSIYRLDVNFKIHEK